MDIFIETHLKLSQAIQPEVDALDTDQLKALRNSLTSVDADIQKLIERARSLERILNDYRNSIDRRHWKLDREKKELAAAQNGYTIGSYHYIDRHVGIYQVREISASYITMNQYKENNAYPTTKRFNINNVDSRLTPLRTQGPFKVGETVSRNGQEFTVIGYLGYRMVLRSIDQWGRDRYDIVQKKDEQTYRSLII